MAHSVPPLPYDYNALEPHIDEQTMRIHHDKHHAAYVNNLNAALEKHPDLQNKSAEDLIKDINTVPDAIRTAVRNNGGGHVNHTLFWQILKKNGGQPKAKYQAYVLAFFEKHRADATAAPPKPFINQEVVQILHTQLIERNSKGVYAMDIVVEAADRQGLLRDISEVLTKQRVNVIGVASQSTKGSGERRAFMTFTVEIDNAERLAQVLQMVGRVDGVESARRR